jgi:hypothetical protein
MSANIVLSLSATKLEVAPGESVEATITIRNQSQIVDQFGIRIQGLSPTWWTLSTSSVSLFPGDQGEAKLSIHPPKEAESKAGSYSFQVRAVSQANPEEITEEEAYLILRGFLVWDVEMSPTKVVGRSGTYRLAASNSSNTDTTLIFEGKDPEEALDYTFSHNKVTVPAGESALITLQVRPKKGEKGKLYNFQVLVRPADAKVPSKEAKTINGQFEYQRRWPWKWILLGLVLLAAAFVILKFIVPLPVINSFNATPTSIFYSGGSMLSWNVSSSTPVTVTINHGIGKVNSTGTCEVYPTTTTTYTLEASNVRGKTTMTVVIKVLPLINAFSANPISITTGGSSMLSWNVSGATTVTIDHGIGTFTPTGNRTVSPTTTTTYTLTASNAAGNVTATAQVIVSPPSLPIINYFDASPTTIFAGGSSTLSWSVSNADTVSMYSGEEPSIVILPNHTGTRIVSPTTSTTYTLEANNEAGSITATVQVTVLEWELAPIKPIPLTPVFP